MVSQAELIPRVITLWFLNFFRDGMGLFNTSWACKNNDNSDALSHAPQFGLAVQPLLQLLS